MLKYIWAQTQVGGPQRLLICAEEDSPIYLSYNTMSSPSIFVANMVLCESVCVC